MTILSLAAGRLVWRLFHRPPEFPSGVPRWQRRAAHVVHGCSTRSSSRCRSRAGRTVPRPASRSSTSDSLPLPDWVPVDPVLAKRLMTAARVARLHARRPWSLLHVAAAVQHSTRRAGRLPATDGARRLKVPDPSTSRIVHVPPSHACPRIAVVALGSAARLVRAEARARRRARSASSASRWASRCRESSSTSTARSTSTRRSPKADASRSPSISAASPIGTPETAVELKKPEWFDVGEESERRPSSRRRSSRLGGGKVDVIGKLTIKGITNEIHVPMTLAHAGRPAEGDRRIHDQAARLQDRRRRMGRHRPRRRRGGGSTAAHRAGHAPTP